MDSLSPTLSAHDKSAEAAAMEDQKEDQQSHEEGDGLEAAGKGHCGPVSTSGFITAPNSNFYRLLDSMFSNPYYPLAFALVGCSVFARDFLSASKPGINPWVHWMTSITLDPLWQIYNGCHYSISSILLGIWERPELISKQPSIRISPPPIVIGSIALHAVQLKPATSRHKRMGIMCCKLLVLAISLFGLFNCLRAPSYYWDDLGLNAKWIMAPSTRKFVVPIPLALICYDVCCLLWTCVATPIIIWAVLMNLAFCHAWAGVWQYQEPLAPTGAFTQYINKVVGRVGFVPWTRMAMIRLQSLKLLNPPVTVVAWVYFGNRRIIEAHLD